MNTFALYFSILFPFYAMGSSLEGTNYPEQDPCACFAVPNYMDVNGIRYRTKPYSHKQNLEIELAKVKNNLKFKTEAPDQWKWKVREAEEHLAECLKIEQRCRDMQELKHLRKVCGNKTKAE